MEKFLLERIRYTKTRSREEAEFGKEDAAYALGEQASDERIILQELRRRTVAVGEYMDAGLVKQSDEDVVGLSNMRGKRIRIILEE